jgi:hypothetical protein
MFILCLLKGGKRLGHLLPNPNKLNISRMTYMGLTAYSHFILQNKVSLLFPNSHYNTKSKYCYISYTGIIIVASLLLLLNT